MTPSSSAQAVNILLVGNYLPDGQRSMQRFTNLLAEGLRKNHIRVQVFHPPVLIGQLGAGNHGIGKWLGYLDKYILAPFFLKRAVRRTPGPRVVHICDHSNAIYTRVLQNETHIVTCHDLLAVRSALGEIPQNPLRASGKQQQAMILRGLRRSQSIVSVSGATREDVQRIVGDRAQWSHVISNVLDASFIQAAGTPRNELQATRPCPVQRPEGSELYLHIGGEKWYKNRHAVLRIFAELAKASPQARLAIVGNPFTEAQLANVGCSQFKDRIHYLSGIDDADLRALYAHARLLIFPSWIEGFGWPILEAQACGCPVATLDRAPMNELNATPALCLESNCESSEWAARATAQIESALNKDKPSVATEKLQAFAAGFTNQSAIDAYIKLYTEALTAGGTEA